MTNIKRTNSFSGYTLTETLLVLLVTITLVGLPAFMMTKSKENILVGQFFGSFERHLLHTQQVAVTGEQDTMIYLKKQQLHFVSAYAENIMDIPLELEAVGPEKITFKQGSGNNGRLAKYSFVWKDRKKQIDYQFQMGSGRYVKKISER